MKELNLELGPIQEAWVRSLEQHPERQGFGTLGVLHQNGVDYRACCLGELKITAARISRGRCFNLSHLFMQSAPTPRYLEDGFGSTDYLNNSWEKYGLNSPTGKLSCGMICLGIIAGGRVTEKLLIASLADMNDMGYSWQQIATLVRQRPDWVFTKRV